MSDITRPHRSLVYGPLLTIPVMFASSVIGALLGRYTTVVVSLYLVGVTTVVFLDVRREFQRHQTREKV